MTTLSFGAVLVLMLLLLLVVALWLPLLLLLPRLVEQLLADTSGGACGVFAELLLPLDDEWLGFLFSRDGLNAIGGVGDRVPRDEHGDGGSRTVSDGEGGTHGVGVAAASANDEGVEEEVREVLTLFVASVRCTRVFRRFEFGESDISMGATSTSTKGGLRPCFSIFGSSFGSRFGT